MRTLAQLLPEHPFFAGLGPEAMDLVVGCAHVEHHPAGTVLFRAGEPAATFYVLRRGRVALELHEPRRGTLVVATLGEGEVVGWSWLVAPYRWFFDARVVEAVDAVALDGACLRRKCDDDPRLGYQLLQRVAQVMHERLQDARLRLLDLYGAQP